MRPGLDAFVDAAIVGVVSADGPPSATVSEEASFGSPLATFSEHPR